MVCTACTAIQLQVPLHEDMNISIVSCESLTCVIPQTLQIDNDITLPQVRLCVNHRKTELRSSTTMTLTMTETLTNGRLDIGQRDKQLLLLFASDSTAQLKQTVAITC